MYLCNTISRFGSCAYFGNDTTRWGSVVQFGPLSGRQIAGNEGFQSKTTNGPGDLCLSLQQSTYLFTLPFSLSSSLFRLLQFLCIQNIKLFLDTCKNYFGLKESDLFEPGMLYDLSNFHKVLNTLSKLSQCRKVQIKHPNIL
jgi:hypothetical protein